MGRMVDTGDVARTSLGMALAMSLSSLVLWKSSWLLFPVGSAYGTHGLGVLIGVVVCAGALAWSYVSPRTLNGFAGFLYPPLMIACVLGSYLVGTTGILAIDFAVGFVVPVAGTYLLVFEWFYIAAAKDAETGLLSVLLAWIATVALRAAFGAVQGDSVRLAISVLMLCITWVLLFDSLRRVDRGLPMSSPCPRDSRQSYAHALGSLWRSALYCGAFAFLGGVVRSLSLQIDAMAFVNQASVAGGLVAALAIAAIWRFKTIRLNVARLFWVMFPFLVVLLCVLPFVGMAYFVLVAAALYMLYSFFSLCLQLLCFQTSQDYGVNPVFCLSFQVGIAVAMQGLGYVLGDAPNIDLLAGVSPLASIALFSLAMLALVLYATRAIFPPKEKARDIEFLSLNRPLPARRGDFVDGESALAEIEGPTVAEGEPRAFRSEADADGFADNGDVAGGQPDAAMGSGDLRFPDRLSMRCQLLGEKYFLSQREREVMQLFVRGYTMAAIAQELYISDNTVKTHMRRLYGKLGIHKKQELFALLNSYVD